MQVNQRDPKLHAVGRSVVCYFCNDFFEEKYLHDHVIQCGAVLEVCPKKCGVWIQRNMKDKHIMECKKPRPKSSYDSMRMPINGSGPDDRIAQIEMELITIKSLLADEKRNRQQMQIEILRLQKYNKNIDEYNKQLTSALETLKRSFFEEFEKRKVFNSQIKLQIDKLILQYQIMEDWKKNLDMNFEYLNKCATENDNKHLNIEFNLKNHEKQLTALNRLEIDLNMIAQQVSEEKFNREEENLIWRDELMKFRNFFDQENTMICALWNEQKDEMQNLKHALELQIDVMNDFKNKHNILKLNTKTITQTTTEASDKLDFQNDKINEINILNAQLQQDIKSLELTISDNSLNNYVGILLWRIDHFKEKMENSKDNNTILYSPIINSRQYGYKLRLKVYLNGIKKWKGRHIIASLQVLKGQWDPLLIWPCNIEATILLRDQVKNLSQAKDFVKYINAKRKNGDEDNEEPQESSTQYFFITHATLKKQNYIKDNTIFVEVRIFNDNLQTCKTDSTV